VIWLLLLLLAAAALAPLALSLLRPAQARGRREADRALYRAQLAELARERDAGRLDEASHRAAMVEVQRRLLGAPAEEEDAPAPARAARAPAALTAALFLVPALAFAFYLWRGAPDVPSAPYALRAEAAARQEALLTTLRERIAQLDQRSEQARQGYVLLGGAELSRGNMAAAADAWRRALEARFETGLASDLAEVELDRGETDAASRLIARALREAPGNPRLRFLAGLAEARAGRNETARAAWRALLADTPADAPWRALLERSLAALP